MSKTRKDTIRENLFKKYSVNWKLVRHHYNFHELDERINKEFVEATLCPLCMRVFKEQALNQQTDLPLTLEHLPPEELGGKPSILLCKKCNSTTGHDIDSKLLEYLKVMPFHSSEPKSSVRLKNTTIKSENVEVRGTAILKRESSNTFSFDLDVRDKFRKDRLNKLDYAKQIQITYKPYDPPALHIVHTALLKIGYLLAFRKFGHSFILNENYDSIRTQILNSAEVILPSKGVLNKIGLKAGFYFVKLPLELKGILVVFELLCNGSIIKNGVLLNSPNISAAEYYDYLKRLEENELGIQQEAFLDVDFLSIPENVLRFHNTFI